MKKFTEREGTRGTRADREKWKTRGDQDKKREGRVAKQIAEEPPWMDAAASGWKANTVDEEKGRKTPAREGVTEFQFRSFRASAHNQRETGVESEPVRQREARDGERRGVRDREWERQSSAVHQPREYSTAERETGHPRESRMD